MESAVNAEDAVGLENAAHPAEVAARLGVPVEEVERVHELAGDLPSAPLPAKADAPAILDRLQVPADDAAEIMAGWPDADSPLWTPELRWLLDRTIALVRADLGGSGWLPPGPELPRERGLAWRHLYVYAYLALVDVVMEYHRDHGISESVSWATLADLGRNLGVDRRMNGEGWPVMQAWLTLHARGGLYELGRLQHQRGSVEIGLHIPDAGPLTPETVDASLDEARAFFPRHFPDEAYTVFSCGSWLLDPQLLEYLPASSNIVKFQQRFELEAYEEPEGIDADVEVRRFVFRNLTTPLDQLPRDTVLRRAVIDHLNAGRHWFWRRGTFPI
ncbi:acyltransferase domain-containing protein [Hamadaea tsunoensis]|uniref:acyltransferase domain-containing protein n=1 Tax=Hamadaea tsunoensis TaxID=53368 RepID=UPI001FDF1DAC|nr:acyltransferase domain-containing protein [Hamadaea tsunoensis]